MNQQALTESYFGGCHVVDTVLQRWTSLSCGQMSYSSHKTIKSLLLFSVLLLFSPLFLFSLCAFCTFLNSWHLWTCPPLQITLNVYKRGFGRAHLSPSGVEVKGAWQQQQQQQQYCISWQRCDVQTSRSSTGSITDRTVSKTPSSCCVWQENLMEEQVSPGSWVEMGLLVSATETWLS